MKPPYEQRVDKVSPKPSLLSPQDHMGGSPPILDNHSSRHRNDRSPPQTEQRNNHLFEDNGSVVTNRLDLDRSAADLTDETMLPPAFQEATGNPTTGNPTTDNTRTAAENRMVYHAEGESDVGDSLSVDENKSCRKPNGSINTKKFSKKKDAVLEHFRKFFYWLGGFIFDRAPIFIVCSALFAIVCGISFLSIEFETRADLLYALPVSRARSDLAKQTSLYDKPPRINMVFVVSENDEKVLTPKTLKSMKLLDDYIKNNLTGFLPVPESSEKSSLKFEDVCYRMNLPDVDFSAVSGVSPSTGGNGTISAVGSNNKNRTQSERASCFSMSALDLYRNERQYGNPLATRQWPYIPNIASNKIVKADLVLADPEIIRLDSGTTKLMNATGFLMLYHTKGDTKADLARSLVWEKSLIDLVNSNLMNSNLVDSNLLQGSTDSSTQIGLPPKLKEQLSNFKVVVNAQRSWQDELGRSTSLDARLMRDYVLAYLIISTYMVIMNRSNNLVRSKSVCGFLGSLSALLGFLWGGGICYWLGLRHTPTMHASPFLVLAIGLDNTFVVLNFYTLAFNYVHNPRERCRLALCDSGISLTITTSTSIISFLVGAVGPYLAVRNFCLITAMGLLGGFLFNIVFFYPFLCLEAVAESEGRILFFPHPKWIYNYLPQSALTDDTQIYLEKDQQNAFELHSKHRSEESVQTTGYGTVCRTDGSHIDANNTSSSADISDSNFTRNPLGNTAATKASTFECGGLVLSRHETVKTMDPFNANPFNHGVHRPHYASHNTHGHVPMNAMAWRPTDRNGAVDIDTNSLSQESSSAYFNALADANSAAPNLRPVPRLIPYTSSGMDPSISESCSGADGQVTSDSIPTVADSRDAEDHARFMSNRSCPLLRCDDIDLSRAKYIDMELLNKKSQFEVASIQWRFRRRKTELAKEMKRRNLTVPAPCECRLIHFAPLTASEAQLLSGNQNQKNEPMMRSSDTARQRRLEVDARKEPMKRLDLVDGRVEELPTALLVPDYSVCSQIVETSTEPSGNNGKWSRTFFLDVLGPIWSNAWLQAGFVSLMIIYVGLSLYGAVTMLSAGLDLENLTPPDSYLRQAFDLSHNKFPIFPYETHVLFTSPDISTLVKGRLSGVNSKSADSFSSETSAAASAASEYEAAADSLADANPSGLEMSETSTDSFMKLLGRGAKNSFERNMINTFMSDDYGARRASDLKPLSIGDILAYAGSGDGTDAGLEKWVDTLGEVPWWEPTTVLSLIEMDRQVRSLETTQDVLNGLLLFFQDNASKIFLPGSDSKERRRLFHTLLYKWLSGGVVGQHVRDQFRFADPDPKDPTHLPRLLGFKLAVFHFNFLNSYEQSQYMVRVREMADDLSTDWTKLLSPSLVKSESHETESVEDQAGQPKYTDKDLVERSAPPEFSKFVGQKLNSVKLPDYSRIEKQLNAEGRTTVLPKTGADTKEEKETDSNQAAEEKSGANKSERKWTWFTAKPFMETFLFFESDVTILKSTILNMSTAFLAIVFVSSLLIRGKTAAVLVTVMICSVDLGIFGAMGFWGIHLNVLSMILLVLSIGFSVDYTVHVVHTFAHAVGPTRNHKTVETLILMCNPVTHGAISTLLGILPIYFRKEFIMETFFKMTVLVVAFGFLNGVVFLPIVLSIYGPKVDTTTLHSKALNKSLNDLIHPALLDTFPRPMLYAQQSHVKANKLVFAETHTSEQSMSNLSSSKPDSSIPLSSHRPGSGQPKHFHSYAH